MAAETGPYRVERQVARQLEQVPVALDEDRIEASLEEMSVKGVAVVEGQRVSAVEPLHAGREIILRRLDYEVVVVRHQAVAVAKPPATTCQAVEEGEKDKLIVRVQEDRLSPIPAAGQVEDPPGDL